MTSYHYSALHGAGPWAVIDTTAIRDNLNRALHCAGAGLQGGTPRPRLWAVVKADAYGHGLSQVVPALAQADGLCVGTLDEAYQVRELGWQGPILLLALWGVPLRALADPSLGEVHITIDDAEQVTQLEAGLDSLTHVHAWLRYAGQLRSQGCTASEYPWVFRRLHRLVRTHRLAGAGHLHHYAASEDPQALQLERRTFAEVTASLPGPHCTGNSGALCGAGPGPVHPHGHWLRCGLMLYGASALPGKTGTQLGLSPAMHLHARLQTVRPVKAGETVGYGDSYRAPRDTCIGVVGAGYGHGIPRCLWQRGQVLLGEEGRITPLAGRVAMDCLTVDLGANPRERPGDLVTLWGRAPGGALLPVETIASACDTIAAELLTGVSTRVPRITF